NQDVDPAVGAAFGASETRIRTARLGVEGSWADRWSYVAEANINGGEATWEDLLIAWAPTDNVTVQLGHFKSISLENLTSSRYTTFMERGPFNDLINGADVAGAEQAGAFVRGHFAPVVSDDMTIHLGGWARVRDRGDDTPFRYRVRNNTNFGDRYTDAGSSPLGAGDSDTTWGLEAAGVWRSLSLQGEWANVDVDLTGGGSA